MDGGVWLAWVSVCIVVSWWRPGEQKYGDRRDVETVRCRRIKSLHNINLLSGQSGR